MYSIKDFKKGQTVYVELKGNASRNKKNEELIEEWEVISVGNKYVTATSKKYSFPIKFMETNSNYDSLIEKTDYSVDYILYPSKEEVENKFKKEELYNFIKSKFSSSYSKNQYTLEQLRKIKEILGE